MKPTVTLPVAADAAYTLWSWLDARVVDLPARDRHLLGARLHEAATHLLDHTLAATYAPRGSAERVTQLRACARRINLLRYLLRGALDCALFSRDQHAHAIRQLDDLGRTLGAWLRHEGDAR